jgi:hypothetical protein
MNRLAPRPACLFALSLALAPALASATAAATTAGTLDRAFLFGAAQPAAPLPMSEFTPPAGARAPLHAFEGRLVLSRERLLGAMQVHRDDYGTSKSAPDILRHLPPFDFEFVTSGDALVPVRRGSIPSCSSPAACGPTRRMAASRAPRCPSLSRSATPTACTTAS